MSMTSAQDNPGFCLSDSGANHGDAASFDISNALNTLSSLQSPDFMEDSTGKLPQISMGQGEVHNDDVVKLALGDDGEEDKAQTSCSSAVTNYYFPTFPGMTAMPCMPAMPTMPAMPAMPAMPVMPTMPLSSSGPMVTGTPLQDFAQQWQMQQQQQQTAMCWWWQMWMQQMYSSMSAFNTPQNMQEMMQQYQAMFANSQQYQNMFNPQQYQQWMQQAAAMQSAMQNAMQQQPTRLPTAEQVPACPTEVTTSETPSESNSGGKRAREPAPNAQNFQNQNVPKRGRRATKEQKVCKNCGTKSTPFWRKDKHDGRPLCNACGLYFSKNDMPRPKILWKSDDLQLAAAGLIDLPPGGFYGMGDDAGGEDSPDGGNGSLCQDQLFQQTSLANGSAVLSRSSTPAAPFDNTLSGSDVLPAMTAFTNCVSNSGSSNLLNGVELSALQAVANEPSNCFATSVPEETPIVKEEPTA